MKELKKLSSGGKSGPTLWTLAIALTLSINQLIKKRGAPLKAVKKIGRSDGAKTDSAREAGSRA